MFLKECKFLFFVVGLMLLHCMDLNGQTSSQNTTVRTMVVTSEPDATIWVNDVHYGTTGKEGTLTIKVPRTGKLVFRVRALGFAESTKPLSVANASEISVALTKTSDAADLAFQEAEGIAKIDRQKAVELYKNAIKLRANFPEAFVGLARTEVERGNIEAAFAAVNSALKQRPVYPEAVAVKGRLLKDSGEEERAIVEFKRSISQARGNQPEALTGLGLLYQERAEYALGEGDVLPAERDYEEAAKYFTAAIKLLGGSPDTGIIYQMLGRILEHQEKYGKAIDLYQQFLENFPDAVEASAIRSFIVQLKRQMDDQ